ncbi:MAG: NAD(P)H-binding protein, partial [Actinocatenispora sp.]
AALRGVDRAFLMSAQPVGSAPEPTHAQRLAAAARRAGVGHLVLLSVYSGGQGDDILATWHGRTEAAVTSSGPDWTVLRPGRFMSNALHWRDMVARGDTVHVPFAYRPSASIDPADIAAVARVALTTDEHRGRAYQMSGPAVLTPADELRVLGDVLGRDLHLVEPPTEVTRAGMLRSGMSPALVEAALARTTDSDEGTEIHDTVDRVTGRPATTFRQWALRNADQFHGGDVHRPQHTG